MRISTTSFVVLGLIALRGPSTTHELKRAVEHSVGFFWPFPHAQLYDEPARLAKAGLLSVSQEDGGRRRKTYALAEEGDQALRAWLREPVTEAFQLRNIAERFTDRSDLAPRLIPLSLGRRMEQAALAFWREEAARYRAQVLNPCVCVEARWLPCVVR